jgi:hypothetical protein
MERSLFDVRINLFAKWHDCLPAIQIRQAVTEPFPPLRPAHILSSVGVLTGCDRFHDLLSLAESAMPQKIIKFRSMGFMFLPFYGDGNEKLRECFYGRFFSKGPIPSQKRRPRPSKGHCWLFSGRFCRF